MRYIINLSVILIVLCTSTMVYSHNVVRKTEPVNNARLIQFPDTAHYKTLVLDPHTHSSFSDGHVWPSIRVEEAVRDNLDAMAITEHLEYQPHLVDIPHPDRNRAYDIAVKAKGENELMIIAGSEITRLSPEGHINAIFISDANELIKDIVPEDPADTRGYFQKVTEWPAQKAVDAANKQQAFVFWNHPWWGEDFPNGIPVAPKFHRENAKRKNIHGIEIANGNYYSEEAFQIGLDLDLVLIGASDVHELIDWDYEPNDGGHRPVTLVLAKERTQASMREALFAGRTVVWYKNLLIAHEENMRELLNASISVTKAEYRGKSQILDLEIMNHSDASFHMKNNSKYTFSTSADIVEVKPHDSTRIQVKTGKRLNRVKLKFDVLNTLIKPKRHAKFELVTDTMILE